MTKLPAVKILAVDDLDENLVALGALLRGDGIELLLAHSGREALEHLLANDVALALLDVQMPEMDGFELAELMRGTERTRRVPIIFLTAGAHDTQRQFRGYEIGAVDFLFKPLEPLLLRSKVATFVELYRQRLEHDRLAGELREMLRLNEMFVAAVSHDLRSPLSNVIMGASVLDRSLTEPNAKRTLSRMRSSAERVVGMLEQLYDLARARVGGGIAIAPHEMSFRALADKIIDELRLAYPARVIKISYDDGPMTGVWDEARLGQVLANLVSNALRYGTQSEAVHVDIRGAAPSLCLEVKNGGAIAADVLPRIFEPFRRGSDQPTRDSLGLGLYIVQQIVVAHGGTVEVISSIEAGTTFRVEIPRTTPSPLSA